MAHADLFTRCTACLGEIRIARDAAQHGRQIVCGHCGTPAYIWQLLGRTNREEPSQVATELHGTWELATERRSTTPP